MLNPKSPLLLPSQHQRSTPPHTPPHAMFPASKNYVGAFASVVSLPQGMFFEDLLFPQILDFEILMGLGYFLDINHLICYGFS